MENGAGPYHAHMSTGRHYVDAAAGAPLLPSARQAMEEVLTHLDGNPSSSHAEGRAAKDALEEARTRVAAVLTCRPREIVFTSGGTEAANLACLGAARARADGVRRVVLSAVEHPCVDLAARRLAQEGWETERVPVDGLGRVDPEAFARAARAGAAWAALMAANHETGNLFPVEAVGAALAPLRVPLLVDASLIPGRAPLAPIARVADLLVLSGPKLGGPRGSGLLRVRRGVRLEPLFVGGLQEDRARPGSENVANALGLAAALEQVEREARERAERLRAWERAFLAGLGVLTGWRRLGDPDATLPGLLTLLLEHVEGEAVMINLDLAGIAVATGSTCALGGTEVSPSLLAMGLTPRQAAASVRLSPTGDATPDQGAHVAQVLAQVVERLRRLARR